MPRKKAKLTGKTQISISLPGDLVEKIDTLAERENRNRSNYIATQLELLVEAFDSQSGKRKK